MSHNALLYNRTGETLDPSIPRCLLVERATSNGEQELGNGEQGTGTGQRGTRQQVTGNGQRATGNGEQGRGLEMSVQQELA